MTTRGQDERLLDDHFFMATQRWLHRLEVSSVTLACHGGMETPLGTKRRPAIEVPGSLRELPLHRLVDLWLAGVRDVAVAPSPCCGEDELADLAQRWGAVIGDRLAVAVASAAPSRNWVWSLSPTRVPVDRRGLLGLSRLSQPPWPTHDVAADDHARLRASLRAAGVTSLQGPTPGVALVASGCTACGVCVHACPHDALTLSINGAEASLVQATDLCQGEQQCVALCPVDALTATTPLSWADTIDGAPRLLATLEITVCERCRSRFPAGSGSRMCQPCRIRRSDPFGSHLPAAAIELLKARAAHHPS